MRKAKLTEKGKIVLYEEPCRLIPEDAEVIIQVKAVGICGTDMHIFNGERSDVAYPRIMGHELSGIVTETGASVVNVKKGDKVVLDPVMACGICRTCKRGHRNVCADVKCFGVQMDGGFQDYIKVPAAQVYRIPDHVTFEEAALAEPFSVAANILTRTGVSNEDNVAVIGAGTIGLCVIQGAKVMGARVLAMDISDDKLVLAQKFGADVCVNTGKINVLNAVEMFSPGGVDVVVDAVGITPLVEQSIQLVAPYGRVGVISFDERSLPIIPAVVTKKELSILGSRMNCGRMPMVIEWLENRQIDAKSMISKIYPLEQIQEAFEATLKDVKQNVKTIIQL